PSSPTSCITCPVKRVCSRPGGKFMLSMFRLSKIASPIIALVPILAIIGVAASADTDKLRVSIDDVVNAWEARAARVRTLRFKCNDRDRLKRWQFLMPRGIPDPTNPDNRVVPEKEQTYEPSLSVVIDGDSVRYERHDLMGDLKQKLVPQESIWVWTRNEFRR